MFTAFFDGAGSRHDQRFMVVAGFVSTADVWLEFDHKWRTRLAQDGLNCFHMVEFAQSRGEFKNGWKGNEARRRALLSDLMDIIKAHAFRRFGSAIENNLLTESLSPDERRQKFINTYSFLGITCAAQIANWHESNKSPNPIHIVFEDGDLGKGDLQMLLKADFNLAPSFLPKKDKMTPLGLVKGYTPLQAADFYAYEGRLGMINYFDPQRDSRWGLREFYKMPGVLAMYKEENLNDLKTYMSAYVKTVQWWEEISGQKWGHHLKLK